MSTAAVSVIDRHARQRLKRHFNPWNWYPWPEVLMIIGIVSLAGGLYFLDQLFSAVLFAIVSGGLGVLARYWRSLYVASQKEFDHIAETDFTQAQSLALARLEISADDLLHSEPCRFRQASTTRAIGQCFVGIRVGSDEKPRRSPHEYLIVHFGRKHLFVFRCVWDLTSGDTVWEESYEYAYPDIASVFLTHKKDTFRVNLRVRREVLPWWKPQGIVPINDRIQVPGDESVALRLVSGETNDLFSWKRSSNGIPSGEGKKSFQNAQRLQKLVRELKQSQVASTSAATSTPDRAPDTVRDVRSR